jgi:alpha-methylacyl-CoA racemase
MTGWGQTGPRAQTAGHDLNYISLSGAAWYASNQGEPPFTPPTLVGDIGGGALYLVAGVLAGVMAARAGRGGTVVDAAIVDGSAHMMNLLMALAQTGGLSMTRGRSLLDGPHWSRCYACADGGYISVQCLEPKFYAEFLMRLGLTEDPAFAPQFDAARWPQQTALLAGIIARHPRAHWEQVFEGSDACVAPALDPRQSMSDPHMAARGVWQDPDGVLQAAAAPRFSTEPPGGPNAIPARGNSIREPLWIGLQMPPTNSAAKLIYDGARTSIGSAPMAEASALGSTLKTLSGLPAAAQTRSWSSSVRSM